MPHIQPTTNHQPPTHTPNDSVCWFESQRNSRFVSRRRRKTCTNTWRSGAARRNREKSQRGMAWPPCSAALALRFCNSVTLRSFNCPPATHVVHPEQPQCYVETKKMQPGRDGDPDTPSVHVARERGGGPTNPRARPPRRSISPSPWTDQRAMAKHVARRRTNTLRSVCRSRHVLGKRKDGVAWDGTNGTHEPRRDTRRRSRTQWGEGQPPSSSSGAPPCPSQGTCREIVNWQKHRLQRGRTFSGMSPGDCRVTGWPLPEQRAH